jgi:hypothetical protein
MPTLARQAAAIVSLTVPDSLQASATQRLTLPRLIVATLGGLLALISIIQLLAPLHPSWQ